MNDEAPANQQPLEPSNFASFRELKQAQLAQEQASQPEADDAAATPPPEDDAGERQPEPEAAAEEPAEGQPEPEAEADDGAEDDDGFTTDRERELFQRYNEAEERRSSMEKDYRRKTGRLSEAVRNIEEQIAEVEQTANYYAQRADLAMQQYQSVDWQKMQANPQEYQQMQQRYAQDMQQAQQTRAELQQIQERANQLREQQQRYVAEHGKGVLQHQIPNWGNDVYGELKTFAAEQYDYSDAEFDKIVDWRVMKMLYDAKAAGDLKQSSADVIKKQGRQKGKAPAGKRNTPSLQNRDAKGRYEKARSDAIMNPGDRQTMRAVFREKLAAEQKGQNNG